MAENMFVEVAGPDQRAAKKMRPGHCTKNTPSSVSWVDLSRDRYIALIHLVEGCCTLETNATRPKRIHVPK